MLVYTEDCGKINCIKREKDSCCDIRGSSDEAR